MRRFPSSLPSAPGAAASEPEDAASAVVVHVSGAVARPGLVEVPVGSRVAGAIEAAGGLTGDAEQAGVNLAREAVDGEHIHVPDVHAPAAVGAPEASGGSVPVNSATAQELETLPGIGPVLAQRIVEDRDTHGPFASVDDLQRVSGVGPALVERWDGLAHV